MVEYCFETCQAPTVVHGRSYLTFRRIIYEEFQNRNIIFCVGRLYRGNRMCKRDGTYVWEQLSFEGRMRRDTVQRIERASDFRGNK